MAATPDPHRRRRRPTLAVCLLGVGLVLATAVLGVVLVPHSDDVGEVDAVVVLGGGGGERLDVGGALAEARGVPLVLSAEAVALGRGRGLSCAVDVVCMQPDPVTTAGEARTVRGIAAANGWDRIAVATSRFHANRARRLFTQCLGDRVDVVAAPAPAPLLTDVYRYAREALAHLAGVTIRRAC